MTLRQFYLRLAEWCFTEQRRDIRAYLLLIKGLKEVPEPGALFPLLRKRSVEEDLDDEDSDLMKFHAVNAALTPYRKDPYLTRT